MDECYIHFVRVKAETATMVRQRIEYHLGVETDCRLEPGFREAMVTFSGPRHVNLDFLRPDVLPPVR